MEYAYNDGGRKAAGFKTIGRNDCVIRAIAIATGEDYRTLRGLMGDKGVKRPVYDKYLKANGWKFVATMSIGSGCRVHLRANELPAGTIICRLSRHLATAIDGVLHDNHDSRRRGTRCVYGYYIKTLT